MNKSLAVLVKEIFVKKFYKDPKLVFSPGRINLIGEHTDYNDGFVFPAAINKGIYVALEKSDETYSTVIAIDKDESYEFSLKKLDPFPHGSWKNYIIGVVAEIKKITKKLGNFNAVFVGDIPSGAGLSSSAALENGFVYGLNQLFNLKLTKKEMIFISQKAEHNFVGVQCGIMDQYASMFGKEKSAFYLDCRSLERVDYTIELDSYEIILLNSNVAHSLAESEYNVRREVCEKVAGILEVKALRDVTEERLNGIQKELSSAEYEKAMYVIEENKRVFSAVEAIQNKDYLFFGQLLFETHKGLSQQYKVSCKELDFLVDLANKNPNVIGARMMGGGFGGCTINLVHKTQITNFINEVSDLYELAFGIKLSAYRVTLGKGTRLISID